MQIPHKDFISPQPLSVSDSHSIWRGDIGRHCWVSTPESPASEHSRSPADFNLRTNPLCVSPCVCVAFYLPPPVFPPVLRCLFFLLSFPFACILACVTLLSVRAFFFSSLSVSGSVCLLSSVCLATHSQNDFFYSCSPASPPPHPVLFSSYFRVDE